MRRATQGEAIVVPSSNGAWQPALAGTLCGEHCLIPRFWSGGLADRRVSAACNSKRCAHIRAATPVRPLGERTSAVCRVQGNGIHHACATAGLVLGSRRFETGGRPRRIRTSKPPVRGGRSGGRLIGVRLGTASSVFCRRRVDVARARLGRRRQRPVTDRYSRRTVFVGHGFLHRPLQLTSSRLWHEHDYAQAASSSRYFRIRR
jgi:hypothetical protein